MRVRRSLSRGGRRRRRRVGRRGRGKAWDWIKGAAGKVNNFLKGSKILSRVAPTVMGAIPGASKYSGVVSGALNQLGYGRRRGSRKGKMPPALAAYWAKRRGGRRRRAGSKRRGRSRRGRGMPVSLGTAAMSTYPYQTSFARVRF